ncbi:DUF6010 family protein [Pseudomonas sp. DR48]|uniref:DUF6010 family protein n=1 Tax=Pseudomonas sp. DR48 TaxID=2871095 RepID=UPI001C990BAC|nr:DUF6010 family protein [Pseudomonas sp. DR48]QZP31516.1 hypothetical protein K5K95_25585 [Pseudomonas sp. DR48]
MIEGITGLLVGVASIFLAKQLSGERWMYAACLVTLPAIYCLFALYAGDRATGLKELMVGIPFLLGGLLFAFASLPTSGYVVGGLWLLHGMYDMTHELFFTNPGAPDWYPVFCASVDFVIGFYVLWLGIRLKKTDLRTT